MKEDEVCGLERERGLPEGVAIARNNIKNAS